MTEQRKEGHRENNYSQYPIQTGEYNITKELYCQELKINCSFHGNVSAQLQSDASAIVD